MAKKKIKVHPKKGKRTAALTRRPSKLFRDQLDSIRSLENAKDDAIERGLSGAAQRFAWELELARRRYSNDIEYYKSSISLLRKFYPGFDPKSGISLDRRRLVRLSTQKLKQIKSYAQDLRERLASPYKIFTPRSRTSRAGILKFVGQRDRGQRHFIVPVESPSNTKVSVVNGRVQFTRRVKGATLTERMYYLPRRAITFEYLNEDGKEIYLRGPKGGRVPLRRHSVIGMTEEMLDSMPEGVYGVISSRHGWIGAPSKKTLLLEDLRKVWGRYDPSTPDDRYGPAPSIVGFRWLAGTLDKGIKLHTQRMEQRELFRLNRQKQASRERALARRRMSQHKKVTGK